MTLQRAPGEVEFDKVNNEKTNIENADNESADIEKAGIEKANIKGVNIKGANIRKDIWEPKILAFLCNWCSYAGADLAGTSRMQYPHNVRIVRLPCSGRINPIYIIKALLEGADGVMVSGCHPGDCHYMTGNMYARRRFTLLKKLLITAGISPDRIHFTWVSASEGVRFGSAVEEVTEKVRKLGPNRIIADCQKAQGMGNTGQDKEAYKETKVLNGDEHARCATDICGLHQGYKNQKNEIVNVAKKLLKDGTVSAVLAYAPSEIEGDAAPRFFRNVDELDYIKWGETCTSNLANTSTMVLVTKGILLYLSRIRDKTSAPIRGITGIITSNIN
jgi:F420-non-reducing hydrogenase iron-sulfur subunit